MTEETKPGQGEAIQRYAADAAMFEAAPMRVNPAAGAGVYLLQATPDPLGAVAAMWRMYKGIPTYHINDISDAERQDAWKDMQLTHLQAPLESIKLHFFIEGVDRALTHQLVRQRTAVYAQESLRFAVKEDLVRDSTLPPSLIFGKDVEEERMMWEAALHTIEQTYMRLIELGIPAEDARGLLPQCVATRIHYITDLRNLVDHAGNRLCTQAQFAWRDLFRGIVTAIAKFDGAFVPHHIEADRYVAKGLGLDEHPADRAYGRATDWQFKAIAHSDFFRPVCFRLGHCAFMAGIDRECSIRDRVQAGEWDKIEDHEWMRDHASAR